MRMTYLMLMLVLAVALGFGQQKQPEFLILAPKSTSTIPLLFVEQLDREYDVVPGVSVRVQFFTVHPQALARLLIGDAQALLTGTSQGWENHLDGGPVVMLNTGVWGVSSIVARLQGFDAPQMLKGTKVALPFPGAPLDVQMRYLWKEHGIDPEKDLKIVYAAPAQAAGMLLSGAVDAAPLPEPLATNLVVNRGLYRGFELSDAWSVVSGGNHASPQVSLFAVRSVVDARTAAFQALVEAWRYASGRVSGDPGGIAPEFAPVLELPVPIVTEALTRTILFVPDSSENTRRVREYFDLVRSIYPEDRPSLDDAFFHGF